MTRRRVVALMAGVLLSGATVFLILHDLDLRATASALQTAHKGWIVASVSAFGVGYACRIERWRAMLATEEHDIGWVRCAIPFMVSIAANNVMPFRAGDIMRGFAFSHWIGVGSARIVASMIVERLLDLLSVLVALALALIFLGSRYPGTQEVVGVGASALLALAAAAALAFLSPSPFERMTHLLAHILGGYFPAIARALRSESEKLFSTMKKLSRGLQAFRLLGLSLAAWSFEGLVFYFAARAIPGMSDPLPALIAMPVGTLSTLLPSTPGYIGTFHWFVMEASKAVGAHEVAGAAYAVLVHLVLWGTGTLVGAICFIVLGLVGARPPLPKGKAPS